MPICRIVFSGLCAFVPRDGSFLDPNDPPAGITVFLPNVLDPISIDGKLSKTIVPPHFPLLEFKLRHLKDGNTRDFLLFQKSSEEDDKGLHPLFRRDIEIMIDGSPVPFPGIDCVHRPPFLVHDPDYSDGPTDASVPGGVDYLDYLDDDVIWLIQLDDIYYPVHCAIKPKLLSSLVGKDDVTTRLELKTGRFMTYEVKEDWYPVKVEDIVFLSALNLLFDRLPVFKRVPRRLLAGSVQYDIKVATKMAIEFSFNEEISFVMKEFGGKDPRTLVFAPPQDHPGEDVEIVVKNLEANEHFGLPDVTSELIGKDNKHGGVTVRLDPEIEIYRKLLIFDEDHDDLILLAGLITSTSGKPCSPVGIPESLPSVAAAASGNNPTKQSRAKAVGVRKGSKDTGRKKKVGPK
jgi:hypothetical protein